jgi:hypothetical protein
MIQRTQDCQELPDALTLGNECTRSAISLTLVIVPVIFETCGQATTFVLSDSKDRNSASSQTGFLELVADHHFTASPSRLAAWSQGETLASWFSFEIINSSPGWKSKAKDKLCRSCVVDGPIAIY